CDSNDDSCTPRGSSRTITLTAADVGSRIGLVVTGVAGGGSSSESAYNVGPVTPPAPAPTSPPTTSGEARAGEALVGSHGTYEPPPSSYGDSWLRCDPDGNACEEARTGSSYTPIDYDAGHTLRFRTYANGAGGVSGPWDSAPTAIVKPAHPHPRE